MGFDHFERRRITADYLARTLRLFHYNAAHCIRQVFPVHLMQIEKPALPRSTRCLIICDTAVRNNATLSWLSLKSGSGCIGGYSALRGQ